MGLKCRTPFSNAGPGALAFPSGEDFRIASEQGLGHQDLLSAPSPPLGGSLEGLREASWLGGLHKMATSLPSGIKSLTQKPESPKSCQCAGTSTLPCPAVLLSILLLQTQPKGSQTSPVPSSSCPMCFPDVKEVLSRWDRKKAGNISLEMVSGEPPLWWEMNQ